jgi:hypothetical protein
MNSPEYQDNIRERILAGRAVPIEQTGPYYTAGKPTDKVGIEPDNRGSAGVTDIHSHRRINHLGTGTRHA